MNTVPTGARPDGEQHVAHALCRSFDEILLLEHAHAHRIDEWIAAIAGREIDLAAERRHPDAIAVIADATHHAGEQIAITRIVERSEPQAVQEGDGARAHREDVAQDAARAGGCSLIRLDGRRVVMGFDFERDRPAARQSQDTGVFAGALDDLPPRRRKGLQDRL